MPPLTEALGIPGAHAVSLLDPDGPRVLWWAGETAPTEQEAAAAVTLAAASAGLVLLDGKGSDELGDILLTSADAFHVVRLVGEEAPLVAHLTLRRAGANLAMARREFGALIKSYAQEVVRPQPALPTTSLDIDLTPRDLGGGTVDLSASLTGPAGFRSAGFSPDFAPSSPEAAGGDSPADLPRRHRLEKSEPDESSDLLDLLGRPYVTDDDVLDRVLVALRSL
ncbi:hypothetical protein OWR29_06300 [Actinoplanes sp. Pm04-4]|uniref:Roadblock/LAMTOR2 domain-containing protein n=1 Tax=Paractinoplanes pyxinae TaxID=2997416 RepID=A0ABT4ATP1_9ACTN|nr:hypothetical protein [Actinoplanes pyxinae]MCY1137606.1 hypothetical protein [Actinoplanes pyxinae]